MNHRRTMLRVIGAAIATDIACGLLFAYAQHIAWWHGLYNALANAVTVGGDVVPTTPLGWATNAIECILVVPLFAATLSLFTTVLTAERVEAHVDKRHAELRKHITAVAKETTG